MDKKNLAKVMPLATALLTLAAISTAQAAGHRHHLPSGLKITETETVAADTHTVGSDTHTVNTETHTVESATVESETHTVGAHIDSETVESETVHTPLLFGSNESEHGGVVAPATHPVIVRAPESHSHSGNQTQPVISPSNNEHEGN